MLPVKEKLKKFLLALNEASNRKRFTIKKDRKQSPIRKEIKLSILWLFFDCIKIVLNSINFSFFFK
jgi:hypothetical protein